MNIVILGNEARSALAGRDPISVWLGDFYPAMPENKEENKIRRSLFHPYDIRFGP